MKTSKPPKRHHFIPESYQRLFQNKTTEKIHFLNKITLKTATPNPKNILLENSLYTADIEPNPTEIENPLLSNLDGRYAKLMKDFPLALSDADRVTLSLYVAFLRFRTPSAIENVGERASDFMLGSLFKKIGGNAALAEQAKAAGINLDDPGSFEDSLNTLEISLNRNGMLAGFLAQAISFAFYLATRNWKILVSDDASFITSDKPFSHLEEEIEDDGKTIVKQKFIIPLSSKFCLEIGDSNTPLEFETLSADGVAGRCCINPFGGQADVYAQRVAS